MIDLGSIAGQRLSAYKNGQRVDSFGRSWLPWS
jgi:hypothetical protein